MNLGEKIVRLRKEKGMSQEKLAEALEVSRQAVYKWEINESMPDMGKIAKMVEIFGVSYDFLLNDKIGFDDKPETQEHDVEPLPVEEEPQPAEEASPAPNPNPAPTPTPIPVVVPITQNNANPQPASESKPKPLAVCAVCGKEIYEENDLIRHPATFTTDANGMKHMTSQAFDECQSCVKKTLKVKYTGELQEIKKSNKKAIIIGIIVTVLVFAILLGAGISSGETSVIIAAVVAGVLLFPTIYSVVIDNTFAGDLWVDVGTWGFVRMPGVIFSLDFDGIVFLILTKILLTILGFLLAAFTIVLATVLCMILCPISFPLSIVRYRRQKKELEDNIAKSMK